MTNVREAGFGFRKASQMNIETEIEGGALTARVSGRIDSKHAAEFETALKGIIADEDRPVMVDLAGVNFIGSSGLRTLLTTATILRERGTGFAVFCPYRPLRRLFKLSGLDRVIPVAASRVKAIRTAAS